jgi:hypothetical protein
MIDLYSKEKTLFKITFITNVPSPSIYPIKRDVNNLSSKLHSLKVGGL